MAAERDSNVRPPQAVSSDGAVYETATGRAEAHYYHFSHDKAGMGSVDKAKVAAVVHSMSEGSSFYRNEERRDARIQQQIEGMRRKWQALREGGLELEGAAATARRERAAMEATRRLDRVWVVVDMDMFFAAVEMRDRPELRDQPMAVGGPGMLSTANYAARKFGVRSAMPGFIAQKLCPTLVIVRPKYEKYKAAAKLAKQVFRRFDPQCVALSLDEAYLDITHAVLRRTGGLPATVQRPQSASPGPGRATAEKPPPGGAAAVERGTGMLTSSVGGVAGRAARSASESGNRAEAASRLLSDAASCSSPSVTRGSPCEEDAGDHDEPPSPVAVAGERDGVAAPGVQRGSGNWAIKHPLAQPGQSEGGAAAEGGRATGPQQREGAKRYALLSRNEAAARSASLSMAGFHEAVWDVVAEIRRDVSVATGGLTCSAGAAPNAMLAKIASDMNKPNGQCLVPFDVASILGFVGALPLRRLPGIGRVSETQLGGLGLHVVADVRDEAARLHCVLTPRMATWLHRVSLGIAESGRGESESGGQYRRKSISLERTFRDEGSLSALQATAGGLASKLALQMQGSKAPTAAADAGSDSDELRPAVAMAGAGAREGAEDDGVQAVKPPRGHVPGFFGMAESDSDSDDAEGPRVRPAMRGRTVTVKLKLATFKVLQRSVTLAEPTNSAEVIGATCKRLIAQESERFKAAHGGKPLVLRLLGVKMHGLVFDDEEGEGEQAGAAQMSKLESFFGVQRATDAAEEPAQQHLRPNVTPKAAAPQASAVVEKQKSPGRVVETVRPPAKRPRFRDLPPAASDNEVMDLLSDGSDDAEDETTAPPELADPATVGQGRRPVLRAVLDERLRLMRQHQHQQQHPAKRGKRAPAAGGGQRSLSGFVSIT